MRDFGVIQGELLVEGLDGYVGLWQVVNRVRRLHDSLTPQEPREITLARLRPLILDRLIQPGFPCKGGGFTAWNEDADAAFERIEMEWKQLGRDPRTWDICWFKNTAEGNALARKFIV